MSSERTLQFRALHAGYYVAPADGGAKVELGAPLWVVRTTPALLARNDGRPYMVVAPDDYVVRQGLGLSEALRYADTVFASAQASVT